VSHNRRFATAVFGERQTVRQKVLLPLWVLVVRKRSDGSIEAWRLRRGGDARSFFGD